MLDDFRDEELNNSGEFLDEFRQRLNSRPLDSVDEHRATVGRSQQIFLSALLGIGLAGVVSWFIFSPEYAKVENAEIPVVRRPQTAVKVQPAEPGGMEILNQDKTVYDIVEKKDAAEEKVESILPPPEEPVLPIIEEKKENVDVVQAAEEILNNKQEKTEEQAILPPEEKVEIKKVEEQAKEPENKKVVEQKEVKPVEKTVAENKQEKKIEPAKEPEVRDIPLGVWQIQLMSSPNAKAMEKSWSDLKLRYPSLKALPHEVEKADLGAKGMFYRLKAGAFVDRSDADKLCNSIKNSGGTCLVKKK